MSQKSATTLHFEFRVEDNSSNKIESIYVDNISKFEAPLGEIMEHLLDMYPKLPQNLHMKLYTNLRLSHSFGRAADRLKENLKIRKKILFCRLFDPIPFYNDEFF